MVYNDLGAASSAANGYRLARQMLAGDFPQTAVFAPSDAMALGVLQAADELGVSVPGRLSLLGYDDIEYAALPKIRLSTLAQPTGALARSAVQLLLELVEEDAPPLLYPQAHHPPGWWSGAPAGPFSPPGGDPAGRQRAGAVRTFCRRRGSLRGRRTFPQV